MDTLSEELRLVGFMMRAVHVAGVSATRQQLEKLCNETGNMRFDDPMVELIVCKVADEFQIPSYEIIFGIGRSNERTLAIGFCGYYLLHHSCYDIDLIVEKLKKGKTTLYRHMVRVKRLSQHHEASKKYYQIKQKLDIIFPIKK